MPTTCALANAIIAFNIAAFSFPNISIAILIVNILDPNPWRKRLLYGMCYVQVISAMLIVVLIFCQCRPVQMMWDPSVQGTCWNPDIFNGYSYFVSAYTTLTDIILAIVPITVLWKLQMPKSTKIGICIMMAMTLLSAIVTLVKACYLHLFTDRTDPRMSHSQRTRPCCIANSIAQYTMLSHWLFGASSSRTSS